MARPSNTPMMSGSPDGAKSSARLSERAPYVIASVIFLCAVGATIYFTKSMSGGMPMPGNWTMSMMWMPIGRKVWICCYIHGYVVGDDAWHGYYAFRRGIATLANTVSRDPMAAKGLLRHSSVNTTLAHYIKDVTEVTKNAMTQVEALFTRLDGQSVQ